MSSQIFIQHTTYWKFQPVQEGKKRKYKAYRLEERKLFISIDILIVYIENPKEFLKHGQYFYTENYKVLMKEIKQDLNIDRHTMFIDQMIQHNNCQIFLN